MMILQMRAISVVLLTSVLICCSVSAADSDLDPNQQVAAVTGTKSLFPDSLYGQYTWDQFVTSDLADVTIDLDSPDYNLLNAAVFYYTNKFRTERNRTAFQFDPALRDAAVYHSISMIEYNFYDHKNRKVKGMGDVLERSEFFGFNGYTVGENIDREFLYKYNHKQVYTIIKEGDDVQYVTIDGNNLGQAIPILTYNEFAERLVQEWINSSSHRTNMLNKDYTHLGIGVLPDHTMFGGNNIPEAVATQVFGGLTVRN